MSTDREMLHYALGIVRSVERIESNSSTLQELVRALSQHLGKDEDGQALSIQDTAVRSSEDGFKASTQAEAVRAAYGASYGQD